MKKKDLTDAEKLRILELLYLRRAQEEVAEETHHRKAKIGEVLREFKEDSWERAKALCSEHKHLLSLRDDYVDRMEAEANLEKENIRKSIRALRQGLAVQEAYSILRGEWIETQDSPPPEV